MTTASLALWLAGLFTIVAPRQAPEACQPCHENVIEARARVPDVHADYTCKSCHRGRAGNPHVPPCTSQEPSACEKIDAQLFDQEKDFLDSCARCHKKEVSEWRLSSHAREKKEGGRAATCADCHGPTHTIVASEGASRAEQKLQLVARCVKCHESAAKGGSARSPVTVETYWDGIHGRMLSLGNQRSASCADCHGAHAVLPTDDSKSKVHAAQRARTCGQCHLNATRSFAGAVTHRRPIAHEDLWHWLVALFFGVLTAGTIALLCLHVALDFTRSIIRHFGAQPAQETPLAHAAPTPQPVRRFDRHMLLQHWGLMLSFVLLVVTGWPLKTAAVGSSSAFVRALGGAERVAFVHHAAGWLLLVVALYHLVYLAVRYRRGNLSLDMLPGLRDVRDFWHNILYFLGRRAERPAFARWTYYEKFDYWAVFWGMVIMGGSGLILLFPVAAARWLPGQVIALAHLAHSDEALLAALAIFLWHFYNVHLRPTVFPMSWVWLTGRISAEALHEEHRAEYEQLFGRDRPAPPRRRRAWHESPIWSFGALLVVMVAGAGVLLVDYDAIHERILKRSTAVESAPSLASASMSAPVPGKTRPSAGQVGFEVFSRCFACHDEEQVKTSRPFPHEDHLEEGDACTDCHETRWHRSILTKREGCIDCHQEEDLAHAKP